MTDEAPIGGLGALVAAAQSADGRALPPVHLWNPAHCGEIDIVVRKDGVWLHDGAPIQRTALVRLFSTVLRKDPDGFHLVTPVEKMRITVQDAPFVAIGVERRVREDGGQSLAFMTNVGDEVVAGPGHNIRVETAANGEPRPYLHVRDGLEALIGRSVFYALADLAEIQEGPSGAVMAVCSQGLWFTLGPVEDAADAAIFNP